MFPHALRGIVTGLRVLDGSGVLVVDLSVLSPIALVFVDAKVSHGTFKVGLTMCVKLCTGGRS